MLTKSCIIIFFLSQEIIESDEFLTCKCKFIFLIAEKIFIIAKLHDKNFLLLTLLTKIIDFPIATIKKISAFSNLVLESRSFVLEANCHLSDFPVNHALSLAIHKSSQIFKLFQLALLCSLISIFPFIDLCEKIFTSLLLSFVFLLEWKVNIRQFVLEHFIFMIKSLTNLVQFFIFFTVLIYFFFLRKTFLAKFSYLHLMIGSIEKHSFTLF